jgi:hypothetical protein
MLVDWLTDMGLVQAGASAVLDTYIGYYRPYATSHDDLDADADVFEEVRNAGRSLVNMVAQMRAGAWTAPDEGLRDPRQK